MNLTEDHFKQIYLDYYSALCYFASKIVDERKDAEDIVEDVFVKFLQTKKSFTEADNVRSYLYTATRNTCLTYLTQSNRAKERQGQYQTELPEAQQSHINDIIKTEVVRSVLQEIRKLPGNSGKIIELSYIDGMKNAQIAEVLNISEQTVKNLKSKGLSILKTKLSPEVFTIFMLIYSLNDL